MSEENRSLIDVTIGTERLANMRELVAAYTCAICLNLMVNPMQVST
jgi:hypothetical protein